MSAMRVVSGGRFLRAVALAGMFLRPDTARAQQHETIRTDLTFYGDNTEFANTFREGETLLGASGQIVLDVSVNEAVSFQGGVFGNERFGSARAFEQVRPVLTLVVKNRTNQFVF